MIKKGYKLVLFHQDSYFVREDFSKDFPSFSVEEVYRDSFYFMTNAHRKVLLDFRRNRKIKEFETSYFNRFELNPLDY